jgi:hypothetical protein
MIPMPLPELEVGEWRSHGDRTMAFLVQGQLPQKHV